MRIKKILLTIALTAAITFCFVSSALAVDQDQRGDLLQGETVDQLYAQDKAFLSQTGLRQGVYIGLVIAPIVRAVLALIGLIFVCLVIYAGYIWLTSAGNEEKIKKAKDIMFAGIIGIAIILSAYAITLIVIHQLTVGSGLSETRLGNKL